MNKKFVSSLVRAIVTDFHNASERLNAWVDPDSIELFSQSECLIAFAHAGPHVLVASLEYLLSSTRVKEEKVVYLVKNAVRQIFLEETAGSFALSPNELQQVRLNALGLPASQYVRYFELERKSVNFTIYDGQLKTVVALNERAQSVVENAVRDSRSLLTESAEKQLEAKGWRRGRANGRSFLYHPLAFVCVLSSEGVNFVGDSKKIYLLGET